MTNNKSKRAVLNLGDLAPEPDILTDEDGTEYALRPATDFSAEDMARLTRLQDQGPRLRKLLKNRDKKKLVEVQISKISAEITRLICPDMPDKRIAELSEGKRGLIYDFWQQCQQTRRAEAVTNPGEGDNDPGE